MRSSTGSDSGLKEEFQIVAHDVHRSFRVGQQDIHVLKGLSVDIRQGEVLFLCGPSGAGKTTFLYTLAGLEEPDKGSVYIGEHCLYKSPKPIQARIRNEMMGYVFQNYFLIPELTALENVLLPAMIGSRDGGEEAASLLQKVGLNHRTNHLPAELSGGEQQRVAIARALVNDPFVIFADEPTGNLDSKTGRAVMELLLDLARASGKTLIVVTHDVKLSKLGDRVLYLVDGQIAK